MHHIDLHLALDIDAARRTNEFGQPVLSDYGADDLNGYRDDVPQRPAVGVTASAPVAAPRLVAVLDPDAPAKRDRTPQLREPDFLDPTTGEAVWIGEDGAVSVPVALLPALERLVDQAGWHARQGTDPASLGVLVATFRADFEHVGVSTNGDRRLASTWRALADAVQG